MPRTAGAVTRTAARRTARYRAWQSMRMLRRFTVPDLVATAEVRNDNAGNYVRALLDAGFLRVVKPKREGVKGGHPIYLLVRNTGPKPPLVRGHGRTVWDANTDEEVPRG